MKHTLGVIKWLAIIVAILLIFTPLIIMINIGFNFWLAVVTMVGVFQLLFISIIIIINYIEESDYRSQYGIKRD